VYRNYPGQDFWGPVPPWPQHRTASARRLDPLVVHTTPAAVLFLATGRRISVVFSSHLRALWHYIRRAHCLCGAGMMMLVTGADSTATSVVFDASISGRGRKNCDEILAARTLTDRFPATQSVSQRRYQPILSWPCFVPPRLVVDALQFHRSLGLHPAVHGGALITPTAGRLALAGYPTDDFCGHFDEF